MVIFLEGINCMLSLDKLWIKFVAKFFPSYPQFVQIISHIDNVNYAEYAAKRCNHG